MDSINIITQNESKKMKNNTKIKKCEWCGKEFVAKTAVGKYCSNKCYREVNKLRARELRKSPKQDEKTIKSYEERTRRINRKIELARQQGMSYGEWQALKTIRETRIKL